MAVDDQTVQTGKSYQLKSFCGKVLYVFHGKLTGCEAGGRGKRCGVPRPASFHCLVAATIIVNFREAGKTDRTGRSRNGGGGLSSLQKIKKRCGYQVVVVVGRAAHLGHHVCMSAFYIHYSVCQYLGMYVLIPTVYTWLWRYCCTLV